MGLDKGGCNHELALKADAILNIIVVFSSMRYNRCRRSLCGFGPNQRFFYIAGGVFSEREEKGSGR
jgi:hypothetical protein